MWRRTLRAAASPDAYIAQPAISVPKESLRQVYFFSGEGGKLFPALIF
jgi:hypothetical protein